MLSGEFHVAASRDNRHHHAGEHVQQGHDQDDKEDAGGESRVQQKLDQAKMMAAIGDGRVMQIMADATNVIRSTSNRGDGSARATP